jgi:aryl-alcohol dehydrogenase-like predicted oxidoreductase
MKYRQLGNSPLLVSEIGLGSWLTYAGGVDRDITVACTRAALDLGINFFDTANVYGHGVAEQAWGALFAGVPREEFVISTKVFGTMPGGGGGLGRAEIRRQAEASLRRLRTEFIDLYSAHRYDASVPLEETVAGFQDVVQAGLVRFVGVSEWTSDQIAAACEIAGPGLFVSSQPQYSMLWPVPEKEVFPTCQVHGMTQVVWSPLAQGLLTGKYRVGHEAPQGSRFSDPRMSAWKHLVYSDESLVTVDRLRSVAETHGLTLAHLALAWVLRRQEVSSAITGATSPQQVEANVRASDVVLTDQVLNEVQAVLDSRTHDAVQ